MNQLLIRHDLNSLKGPRHTGGPVFDAAMEAVQIRRLPTHGLLVQRVAES